MALKEKITVDMQDAMRSKDSEKLNAIRLLQSSIKQKEVDDRVEIDDTMILNIIEKMLKQRRDSIEAFKKANRNDLVVKEEFEVKLLQTYMPEPLSSEDVEKEIDSAIKALDAKSMKDMGAVMSAVKLKVSGRANMAEVSQKIKEKLTTGAIIGKVELYDVKKYESLKEIQIDKKKHHASIKSQEKRFGFILKNAKPFRIPIPWKGQLGFFDVNFPKMKNDKIITDMIEEEFTYQWVGHH